MGFEEVSVTWLNHSYVIKMLSKLSLWLPSLLPYYRSRGLTLADGIEEIYKEYGYYACRKTISLEAAHENEPRLAA